MPSWKYPPTHQTEFGSTRSITWRAGPPSGESRGSIRHGRTELCLMRGGVLGGEAL